MKWISDRIAQGRARRFMRASIYRSALEDLPVGLDMAWRRAAPKEYPGIRTDAFFFACAAEGLMRFFDAVRRSSRPCALPSEAADSVWHAWLRHDPIGLERFCRKHFGRVIPHVERAALETGALAATLLTGRRMEKIAPLGPELPRLFGLDARLRMPGGHGYWSRDGGIVYARLGRRDSFPGRASPHPELTISALLAAGLIDADMVLAHLQRLQRMRPAAGADPFMTGAASLSFAADGGCDGGGSCGGSCGGGGD